MIINKDKLKNIFYKLGIIVLSVLMIFSSLMSSNAINSVSAADYVNVTKDANYNYAAYKMGLSTWSTKKYTVTIDDKMTNAFCLEPDKKAPDSGLFHKQLLDVSSDAAKVMYYGWVAKGDDNYWTHYYSSLAYGARYIAVHMAVAKAEGNKWDYRASEYGKDIATKLLEWVKTKPDIPGRNGVYFQYAGAVVSQITENDTATIEEYFRNISNIREHEWLLNLKGRLARGVSIRSYSDLQDVSVILPSNIRCVELKNDSSRAYVGFHDYGTSWTVSSDKLGDNVYVFIMKDGDNSCDEIKLKGTNISETVKAYKLVNTKATQDLGTIVSTSSPASGTLSIQWNQSADLTITKDDEYGENVAGAVFHIGKSKSENNVTDVVETVTTDSHGEWTSTLEPGIYYIQEISVPAPFKVDTSIEKVELRAGDSKKVKFTNQHQTGSVTIGKLDSYTGEHVIDVALSIVNTTPIIFYKVSEDDFPIDDSLEDYVDPDFILDSGDLEDETKGKPITYQPGEFVYTFLTDGKNKVIDNLPIGSYKIIESNAKDGYVQPNLNESVANFKISYSQPDAMIGRDITESVKKDIKNTPVRGEISLNKVDAQTQLKIPQGDAKLIGAEYILKAKDNIYEPASGKLLYAKDSVITKKIVGNSVWGDIGRKTVDKNNNITWINLPTGIYYIEETKAPEGYQLNNAAQEVVISNANLSNDKSGIVRESVSSTDHVFKGEFEIYKYDSNTGKQITDVRKEATFIVKPVNTMNVGGKNYTPNDIIMTLKTVKGYVKSGKLPYGTYDIIETSAPKDYISASAQRIKISKDEEVIKVTFKDEPKFGSASLTKVLEKTELDKLRNDGYKYVGDATVNEATYTLYAQENIYDPADGTILFTKDSPISKKTVGVGTWGDAGTKKTGKDGKILWSHLPMGKYYFLETGASEGCLTDKVKHSFELKETKPNVAEIIKSDDMISTEFVKQQRINIFKQDIGGDNNTIYGKVEGLNGAEFTIKLLSEIERLAGGKKAEVTKEKWDDAFNQAHTYDVVMTKTDENGQEGYALTQPLAAGVYYMRETQTPDGYLQGPDCQFSIIKDQIHVNQMDSEKVNEQHIIYNDEVYEAYVRIIKKDKTIVLSTQDGKETVINDKIVSFNSATFKIKNIDTGKYVSQKIGLFYYDKFTTNAENKIIPALTGGNFTNIDEALGTITTPLKLPYGHYNIEEINTPEGFLFLDEPVELNLTSEQTVWDLTENQDGDYVFDIVIKNEQPTGQLEIEKDIYTDDKVDFSYLLSNRENQDLSFIKFKLTAKEDILDYSDGSYFYKKGDIIFESNLTKDGKLNVQNIPMGKYVLTETETLPSLHLTSKEYEVELTKEDNTTKVYKISFTKDTGNEVTNIPTYTDITKTDITGEKEVEGALLQLINSKGQIIDEWISGKTPHRIEGLHREETYTLHEESAPEGFVKVNNIQFTIKNNVKNQEVKLIDTIVSAHKIDVSEHHVAGAKIQVISPKTKQIVDQWMTDGKTEHKISNLEANQTYIMQEVETPKGYVKASDIEFIASNNKDIEIKMCDKKVGFLKLDEDGKPVKKAYIQIISEKTQKVVDEFETDGNIYYINNLMENEIYIAREVGIPNGYASTNDIKFIVHDLKENQIIQMIDQKIKIDISKTDITGEKELSGNHLKVIDDLGKEIDSWISKEQPHRIEKLTVGKTYTLIETQPADGYTTVTSINFTIKDTGEVQKIIMKNDVTKVDISKIDITTGKELPGNHLKVVDDQGKEIDSWISGTTSHRIEKLIVGKTYTLIETQPADGYTTATSISFTVEDTGKIQKVIMKNDVTKVDISKIDITTGKELPGNHLKVVDDQGKEIDSWISGTTSHRIEKLTVGKTYTLIETQPADGYTTATSISFTVEDTGKIQKVIMKNIQTTTKILKVDEHGEPLEGAQLQMIDAKSHKIVDEWTSNKVGHMIQGLVVNRRYILHEVKAPNGYILGEDLELAVKDQKEVQEVLFKNIKVPIISIVKTDDPSLFINYLIVGVISYILLMIFLRKKENE